jgi:hypothetical protein
MSAIDQLAPRNVPPQPEPQPDSPRYVPQKEDNFEIVVMVPAGEDMQEAQQLPHNDNHDDDHGEEENEEEEEEGNETKDEDDENYTPLSDFEKEKEYHIVDEIKTFGNEASIPTTRLRELLNCVSITTPPEFRVKKVLCPGREEYKAIVGIISGHNVLSHHQGLAFRATHQAAVGDATW